MNKLTKIILVLLIVSSVLIFVVAISKSTLSYSSFSEIPKKNQVIQIIGKIDLNSIKEKNKSTSFNIYDENNNAISVFSSKPLPNILQKKVMVKGLYNYSLNNLQASKILTKCPSKYDKGLKK